LARGGEVFFSVDYVGGVAITEKVSSSPVAEVEALRIDAVQPVESRGEILAERREHEVVVIRHQAEGLGSPDVALHGVAQELEKAAAVPVVAEDRAAVDAPGRNVEVAVRQI
jgi:hypothetical protein